MTNKHIIMDNEKEVIVEDVEANEEVGENDSTHGEQEKAVESPEARYARLKRQTEQAAKKLGIDVEKKEVKSKQSNDLDYGQKAYLIANGIKGKAELDFVKELQAETGKDIDSLMETTYFQSQLAEFREQNNTANAIPKGNGKGSSPSVDSVDYWIAKGELPPASEVELRQKVVNARMKKESSKGVFYNS